MATVPSLAAQRAALRKQNAAYQARRTLARLKVDYARRQPYTLGCHIACVRQGQLPRERGMPHSTRACQIASTEELGNTPPPCEWERTVGTQGYPYAPVRPRHAT